jgi:hypothetical protein
MPRPLRPIDNGLIYHVINRGNNRQPVFNKPEDFQAFFPQQLPSNRRIGLNQRHVRKRGDLQIASLTGGLL